VSLKLSRSYALGAALTLGALSVPSAVTGCAVFGSNGPSTVAQGKYYSSGDAQYDEFFLALYQLQVELADAPPIPDRARTNLAQALGLSQETPADGVASALRDEALKFSKTGVHMRLDRNDSDPDPEKAAATVRATMRPASGPAHDLIESVEASTTLLLRSTLEMKKDRTALGKLEVQAITLESEVPNAFAKQGPWKRSEVTKNLDDAQKLVTLMKARAEDVGNASEQLLATFSKALNTDDGSIRVSPAAGEPNSESTAEGADPNKAKAWHTKPRSAAPSDGAAAEVSRSKPVPAAPGKSVEPPATSSKPAAAPRDFEP
jgi:hypothetical protein